MTTGTEQELETIELELLLDGMARRWGFDFRHYARPSLRRRVLSAVERAGAPSISVLQHALLRDADAVRRFVGAMSVRTTSMFRDPEVFRAIREQIVPVLRTYPFVRVWNAGCATGEEAYSLAIVLAEEGLYERARLYATDLSDELVCHARSGVYPLESMKEWEEAYAASGGRGALSEHYISDGERAIIRRELRKNVVFSQHDLVSDHSFNEFHLILCRNVLIYFDDVLRERVHRLLHGSLVRFGMLALGKRESLLGSSFQDQYDVFHEGLGLYRRAR